MSITFECRLPYWPSERPSLEAPLEAQWQALRKT